MQGDLFDENDNTPKKDEAYWRKEDGRLEQLTEKLARDAKNPVTHEMSVEYYSAINELRNAKKNLNAVLNEKAEARKNSDEYKEEQRKAEQERKAEFHRKERENEITSTTHEDWKRRKEKEVNNFMGVKGDEKPTGGAAGADEKKPSGDSPLYIENLSEKAIIVKGNTKTHKDAIKDAVLLS